MARRIDTRCAGLAFWRMKYCSPLGSVPRLTATSTGSVSCRLIGCCATRTAAVAHAMASTATSADVSGARQAALGAGLPVEVPAETVNRVCGSGLQAVVHAVEAIRVGYVDTMLAGGTESMSNAPYLLKGARWGYRMGNAEAIDSMLLEGLTCAMGGCHMGNTAEEVATRYGVLRADQDRFAAESLQ